MATTSSFSESENFLPSWKFTLHTHLSYVNSEDLGSSVPVTAHLFGSDRNSHAVHTFNYEPMTSVQQFPQRFLPQGLLVTIGREDCFQYRLQKLFFVLPPSASFNLTLQAFKDFHSVILHATVLDGRHQGKVAKPLSNCSAELQAAVARASRVFRINLNSVCACSLLDPEELNMLWPRRIAPLCVNISPPSDSNGQNTLLFTAKNKGMIAPIFRAMGSDARVCSFLMDSETVEQFPDGMEATITFVREGGLQFIDYRSCGKVTVPPEVLEDFSEGEDATLNFAYKGRELTFVTEGIESKRKPFTEWNIAVPSLTLAKKTQKPSGFFAKL